MPGIEPWTCGLWPDTELLPLILFGLALVTKLVNLKLICGDRHGYWHCRWMSANQCI